MQYPSTNDIVKTALANHPEGLTLSEIYRKTQHQININTVVRALKRLQTKNEVTATFEPMSKKRPLHNRPVRQRPRYHLTKYTQPHPSLSLEATN